MSIRIGGIYNIVVKRVLAWAAIFGVPLVLLGIFFRFFYSREESMVWSGTTRQYRLHVPWGLKGKVPLVVALHGYGDKPWLMEAYTSLSAKADRERFIVVYPYGVAGEDDPKLSWNGGSCCGAAVDAQADDVGWINALVDKISRERPIDKSRVFAVGFSNGALLVHRLAAQTPEKFAGFGAVAGAVSGKRSQDDELYRLPGPRAGVNMIMAHGKKDKAVPFGGGHNRVLGVSIAEFGSFEESQMYWASANGCGVKKNREERPGYTQITYPGCNRGRLTAYTVDNRAHIWPGGLMEITAYGSTAGLKFTDELWSFFAGL